MVKFLEKFDQINTEKILRKLIVNFEWNLWTCYKFFNKVKEKIWITFAKIFMKFWVNYEYDVEKKIREISEILSKNCEDWLKFERN